MSEQKLLPVVGTERQLLRLEAIYVCGYHAATFGEWGQPTAHWLVNETSACDDCILQIAREHNGEWLLDALVDIADRNQGQMVKLEIPVQCETGLLAQEEYLCSGLAHWRASGFAECDEHIIQCLEWHPDSRESLALALTDLRERYLKPGCRVRIQYGNEKGKLGRIYNDCPGRPARWHVRPDDWPGDVPGIAYKSEELDVLL